MSFNDYNDDYRSNNVDISAMAPLDDDDVRKSGAEREDASGWDKMSDTQRKLIAFGVLFGIVVFLVLMLAVGSSCGACADCAAKAETSASDVEDNEGSDRLPGNVIEDGVSDADAPDEEVSGADVSSGDAQEEIIDDTEYVEVAKPGGLSACSHQADNEAGGGSDTSGGGFLGFLFGCSGCTEGCSIDVSDSLTDQREDSDDPTRQEGMILSGSDAEDHLWETQPDDEAYMAMLRTQLADISEQFSALNALDTTLAPYTDPQRVRENDRFRKQAEDILLWCDAAERYDASALTGDDAFACNMLSVRLAGNLRRYIDEYPLIITGATSGADVLDKADHLNAITGDIVELYAALNPSPVTMVTEDTAE
ncbi:MAG: hypothetical protein E7554_01365 [Ruminococcaceae bacterium]|nr:hypothetical protein [Oscillospiraceae bacterium]